MKWCRLWPALWRSTAAAASPLALSLGMLVQGSGLGRATGVGRISQHGTGAF